MHSSLPALLAFLLGLVPSGFFQQATAQEESQKNFVFLVKGSQSPPPGQAQTMQQQHLSNFKKWFEAKQLLAVGPLQDPTGTLRGIALFDVADPATIELLFEADPYISEKIMTLNINPVASMLGSFSRELDPAQLEELRIVIWDRQSSSNSPSSTPTASVNQADALHLHQTYWRELHEKGECPVYCRFTVDATHFGVAFFPKGDDEHLKNLLEADPMVKYEQIRFQTMPQYLSKGAIPNRPK